MLVASQGDASLKFNQAFLLVDSFNFNFVDEEHSDIVETENCWVSPTYAALGRLAQNKM